MKEKQKKNVSMICSILRYQQHKISVANKSMQSSITILASSQSKILAW
jgi:hypothetical protein